MQTYTGSCHCGGVRFEVELELEHLTTCNCSICGRTGAIMLFVPEDRLRKTAGTELLSDYQFGRKTIHHTFCKVCGIRPYASGVAPDGHPWAMVNVRCLDGIDVHELNVTSRYDGRSRE